jgi:serine/threonine-protein kinase HipA
MLDVYLHDALVGVVSRDARGLLSFRYGERALDEPASSALSVRLPVRREPYDHDAAIAFFENLLPEGEGRDLIAQARHYSPSDVAGLLGMVGGECAGAVSIWPEAIVPPEHPAYQPLSPAEMSALFDQQYGAQVMEMQVAERLSMSGAQQKMVFRRTGEEYALPLHGSPSNVIVKRAKSVYPGLVLNEVACMWLLKEAGLEAAGSRAVGSSGRLLFESLRYDREERGDGSLRRLHQEDLCQATGHRSAEKYQARGGPAYGELATVIRRHSANPLLDLQTLASWAVFNLLVGNNDAHAKNLSLLYTDAGIRLSPVYDVVSTEVYPQLDRDFSIQVGGQRTVDGLHRHALDKFACSLGMKGSGLARLVLPVVERTAAALDPVLHRVAAEYEHHPVLDQIRELVRTRADFAREWLGAGR